VGPGVNGDPLDRHHYDVFPFTVGLTGTYSFRATSNDLRPTVNVYAVSFDPTRPLSNFYNHHGLNSGASLGTRLNLGEFFFAGPGRYYIVVSTEVKNSTGDYSLSQTGGPASITPLQPLVLSSPSTDHTDFGERLVGGQTDARTFTVVNRNGEAVNLVGNPKITLSGAGSGQFFVS